MNAKAMVPLALALVLGITAAFLMRSMMSHRSSAPVGPNNLVTVVVTKQDADPGHALVAEDLGTAKVPAELAPDGQVFSDPAQLVGRVAKVQLVKGQTLLETLLAPAGSGSGLQALIPGGKRAVTLEVTEYSGVGGMLEPGCKVDVISVLNDAKLNQQVARTVLQDMTVTAVGRSITPSHPVPGQPLPPPSNSVTLLCTPKQVQILELAMNNGRPSLVLRSTSDGQQVPLDGTTTAELSGNADSDGPGVLGGLLNFLAGNHGPAATPVTAPAPAQPVAAVVPATLQQAVTMINGGVESHVTVTVPNPQAPAPDAVASPDTSFVNPDGK